MSKRTLDSRLSLQRIVTRCLRKRSGDRYVDAKELAADLKTVQREVESGISSKAPLALRLMSRFAPLRRIPARIVGQGVRPEHVHSPESAAPAPVG